MIETFHRQLKTAIKCHETNSWAEILPVVLMGIRAAWKEDLEVTAAELTFGQTIRLPGEFLGSTDERVPDNPKDYVDELRKVVQKLQPKIKRHGQATVFQFKDLKTATHVFLRRNIPTRVLQPAYKGPYQVIKNGDKILKIKINGKTQNVSTDRVKPAYIMEEQLTEEAAIRKSTIRRKSRTSNTQPNSVRFMSP